MKAQRARFLAASAAAITVALAAGCSSSGTSASSTSTSSSAKPPIVIGASLSLTGDFSADGQAFQKGYSLWVSEVNSQGGILGRQVKLDVLNDNSSPTQVVTNYQKLITGDHVDLVFGPFSSLLTGPSATVANRYHYAFLEPAGGGPKVFALKLHNIFFVQPAPVVKCGDSFVRYLKTLPASQRPKTASYASLDDPFSSPIAV